MNLIFFIVFFLFLFCVFNQNFYYSIIRNSVSKGSMLLYMILLLSIGVLGDFVSNAVQALFSRLT